VKREKNNFRKRQSQRKQTKKNVIRIYYINNVKDL